MRTRHRDSIVIAGVALLVLAVVAASCSEEPSLGDTGVEAATSTTAAATTKPFAAADAAASTTTPSTTAAPRTAAASPTAAADREPPQLVITSPEEGATLTEPEVRFEGHTEPGASVVVWDRWVATVAADGSWSIVLILDPGTNVARITATDGVGNTSVAERIVRYDPPSPPPPATTVAPPSPPPTDVVVFYPAEIPEERRQGSCSFHSVSTWREDAYRCGVDNEIFDPCFDTGEHVICNVSPIRSGPGFILELTEPLPVISIPDGVNPWILEFPDGVVCDSVPGATGTIDGSRIEFGCTDGSWVLENVRPGEVWTGRRIVIDGLSPPIVYDYGFVPIRRVWR
jgi:hypothetical protein